MRFYIYFLSIIAAVSCTSKSEKAPVAATSTPAVAAAQTGVPPAAVPQTAVPAPQPAAVSNMRKA
jgi:hypothetical protein